MIRFKHPDDLNKIKDDPDLWNTIFGCLSVYIAEFLEYESEADLADHDFNIAIVTLQDLAYVKALGEPEEYICTIITSCTGERKIYRYVFPTETIFFENDVATALGLT